MSDTMPTTNFFSTANEGFVTTLGSSILSGATTVPLTSVSGLTNGTIFAGIIELGLTKQQVFTGVVDTAGVQITNVVWVRGANAAHSAGVGIVDYVTGASHNMTTTGILKQHGQDGTHGAITGTSLTVTAGLTATGAITLSGNWTGWLGANESWTYLSATTITVPSDATTKYSVGDKIQLTQTTVKYFYIVGVTSTVLTITGGSDYTLANAAITVNSYSKVASPLGFPYWFNYTPAETGFTSTTPTRISRFRIVGREVNVVSTRSNNQTSNATTYTLTSPVTSANIASMIWRGFVMSAQDNGAVAAVGGMCTIANNTTTINVFINSGGGGWTASGTKGADIGLLYEI